MGYTYRQRPEQAGRRAGKSYVPLLDGFQSICEQRLREALAEALAAAEQATDQEQLEALRDALADAFELAAEATGQATVGLIGRPESIVRQLELRVEDLLDRAQDRLNADQQAALREIDQSKPEFDMLGRLLQLAAGAESQPAPANAADDYEGRRRAKDRLRDELRRLCQERFVRQQREYRMDGDRELLDDFQRFLTAPEQFGSTPRPRPSCCLRKTPPSPPPCSGACLARGIVEQCTVAWPGKWSGVVEALSGNKLARGKTSNDLAGGFLNRPFAVALALVLTSAAIDLFSEIPRPSSASGAGDEGPSGEAGRDHVDSIEGPQPGAQHATDQELASFSQLQREQGRLSATRAFRTLNDHLLVCGDCAGRLVLQRRRATPPAARELWSLPPESAAALVQLVQELPPPPAHEWVRDRRGWIVRAIVRVARGLSNAAPAGDPALEMRGRPAPAAGESAPETSEQPARSSPVLFEPDPGLRAQALAGADEAGRLEIMLLHSERAATRLAGWSVTLRLADGTTWGPRSTGARGVATFPDLPFDPAQFIASGVALTITPPRPVRPPAE